MKRICTICARGGSKGLPGKNTRLLAGKPMLAHSIDHARESGLFDAIAVSSDSDDILELARKWGADLVVRRPDEMATDEASKLPAIQHAVSTVESDMGVTFDIIVDLDATAPLRILEDVLGAVRLCEETGASNVLTAAPARKSPYFNLLERQPDGRITLSKPLPGPRIERRQDSPECFDCNAAVYVWQRDTFMENANVFYDDTQLYVMPPERSHDIDTPLDFEFVELVLSRNSKAGS
jgi:CMP-N,N'-diacetyllegionaminic acid synthase